MRLMNEKLHESKSSLVLGQDTVTALVKQSSVFGQELYEVKIFIAARDKTAS
jgi:sulfur transfer complex TusBCD TusB component (DsrH family)